MRVDSDKNPHTPPYELLSNGYNIMLLLPITFIIVTVELWSIIAAIPPPLYMYCDIYPVKL